MQTVIMRHVPVAMLFVVLLGGGLAGCGGGGGAGRPKTVPASGKVTYNGKPVEGAIVAYLGDAELHPSQAITDANGDFEMTTSSPGDGATPGTHQVTVTKMVPGAKKAATGPASMEDALKAAKEAKEPPPNLYLVPEKYSKAATSGLTVEVKEGDKNFFEIKLVD